MARKLTIKQQRFADEYIISGNRTDAYKKAGYSWKTESGVNSNASNLLRNYKVKNYIDERLKELDAKKFLTMEEALQLTASMARGEPREIIVTKHDESGELVQVKELEYPKHSDMKNALDQFYKINGAFIEKQEIDLKNNYDIHDALDRYEEYLHDED